MKLKKLMTITTFILTIGGLIMFFTLNGDNKLSQEEQRNRQYEVSLVKALKNSYRDIEEIRIIDSEYSTKPDNWHCTVILSFTDGKKIEFGTSYNLTSKHFSTGGIMRQKNGNWEYLLAKQGKTQKITRIIYSNGEEEEL